MSRYHKVVNSIAFYPAFIGLLFLVLSFGIILFDFSDQGKQIKSRLHWLSLKDASTARSIISAIAAGIISLAVFSFSMVMIVLNQAASQMSNRVLDKLIGNRFQQIVLGIYIGTIVYALFLLSTIRDIDSGIYIPALSTYLLIVITIVDIFLFIYFLHYITQSVKYEVIIERIYKDTQEVLEHTCRLDAEPTHTEFPDHPYLICTEKAGIFEGFDKDLLIRLGNDHDCTFAFIHTPGTFILKGLPLMKINRELPEDIQDKVKKVVFLHTSESIQGNFLYGFRQLMEVAIKALSPGINDPGTAVVSLRALFQLLAYRIGYFPDQAIKNQEGQTRIFLAVLSFESIFSQTVLPVWDYGKNDRLIQQELYHLLKQLQSVKSNESVGKLLQKVKLGIDSQELQ